MAFSLPGISDEAIRTVSPGSRLTCWWLLLAMRDSAAIGSPCEPVDINTILFGGAASILSTTTPSGTRR